MKLWNALKKWALTSALIVSAPSVIAAEVVPQAPELNASSWILMDADTGSVLLEHNADERLPPASLTKLMTSYILSYEVEAGRVANEDMVTISENAWSQNPVFGAKFNGSSLMFISPDKPVSILDLHRGIIISSGNDATVAVAEHLAGSESGFADMMNQHAKRLGMKDSQFQNSHGLDAEGHYTTARDLAILSREIIKQQDYPLHAEKEFTYNGIKQPNRNGLLWKDSTVDGLKTGYTSKAGYCLVASAKRGDMRLISVVMGTPSTRERETQSQTLLNYGFRFYERKSFFSEGQVLESAKVWKGSADTVDVVPAKPVSLVVTRKVAANLQAEVTIDKPLQGPLAAGQKVGEIRLKNGDEVVYTVDAVTATEVARAGFFGVMWDSIVLLFAQLFGMKL